MSGLNDLISDVNVKTTTLPAWYDTAQQNLVNQAGNVLQNTMLPSQTVGQQAVDTMTQNNPFTAAQGTLGQASGAVGQGQNALGQAQNMITGQTGTLQQSQNVLSNLANQAANPFATGSTLGQLINSQNAQLNQILPNIAARTDAGAIGTGNFGSLRNLTATNKAKADALLSMIPLQLQAGLESQQQGIQAGSNLANTANIGGQLGGQLTNVGQASGQLGNVLGNIGATQSNVGQQGIDTAMNVGQYQQNAGFAPLSNYAKLLGSVQAPATVSSQQQLSPLNQIAGLIAALGGGDAKTSILGQLGLGGLSGVIGDFGNAITNLLTGQPDTGAANGSSGDTSTEEAFPGYGEQRSNRWQRDED